MKSGLIFSFLAISAIVMKAQELPRVSNSLEINAAAGSYRGTLCTAALRTWKIGKAKKFGIGTGLRFTSLLGANLYYITAPARLTSGSTSPLIIFAENKTENIDSLLVKSPQLNSINFVINLDYNLTYKLTVGFNIDAIGISFGKSVKGNYINGYEGANVEASPTPFNILLISDNDRGSLNSELYLKYNITQQWQLKTGAQFLFTEYTTKIPIQRTPELNDRFRNKSLMFMAGIALKF